MLYKALALAILGVAAHADAAQTFVIDSKNSFVQAYTPTWVNAGPSSAGEGGQTSYNWNLEPKPILFGISGTFQVETSRNPDMPGHGWLTLGNLSLTTTVPSYAGFGLPTHHEFDQNGLLSEPQLANPCSSAAGGNVSIIFSCTTNVIFGNETQGGNYQGTEITLTGSKSPVIAWGPPQVGPNEPAPWTDLSLVSDIYSYSIHASAVPEPATLALLLGGLAMTTVFRRRKAPSM